MKHGWAMAITFLGGVGVAEAQSANELSDASRTVFRAFPHATSYRKIVRDVDQRARRDVERQLPFKVHFNELGPHALYVAFRQLKPVGLMYVRTEDGGWGFSEIGWSLSLDLRIIGFRFLRARSQHRFALQRSPFARSLVGLDYDGLAELLGEDGQLDAQRGAIPAGSEELALAVVRSAMKTTLVTGTVWGRELGKLQGLALGLDVFPAATAVMVQPTRPVDDPGRRVLAIRAVRAVGTASTDLGIAAHTESEHGERVVTLRWALTPKLRVLRVEPTDAKDDAGLRAACTELLGRSLSNPGSGPLAATARELAEIMLRSAPDGGTPR